MRPLESLQLAFAHAITADADEIDVFRGTDASVRDRLGYYRAAQAGTASKVLRAAYPVVLALVGDECFDALCEDCRQAHPSQDPDLHRFGAPFADFLAAFAPMADYPWLPDVARLEWLCHASYYAADDEALAVDALRGMTPDAVAALPVTLCDSARLFTSRWSAVRIWLAHQPGGPALPDSPDAPDQGIVVRPDWRVIVLPLSPAEAEALATCPATLGDLLQHALTRDPTLDPGAMLAAWLDHGVLRRAD